MQIGCILLNLCRWNRQSFGTILVYDKQVAQDVNAFQYGARLQGQYIISATVADGHTTEEVVAAIDEALEIKKPVSLRNKSKSQNSVGKIDFIKDSNHQSQGRYAEQYNTTVGDPGFVQRT